MEQAASNRLQRVTVTSELNTAASRSVFDKTNLGSPSEGYTSDGRVRCSREGDLERVRAVVDEEAGLVHATDENGWTPLLFAACDGHVDVAQYPLGHGATINHRNRFRKTALHWACGRGHTRVVLPLLESGADITAVDDHGWTSLMLAAARGYDAVVHVLVEHGGSNVDAADENRRTACHWACSRGRSGVLRQLLFAGADPTLRDTHGHTGFDLARERGHQECVTILQEWEQTYLLRKFRGLHDASSTSS